MAIGIFGFVWPVVGDVAIVTLVTIAIVLMASRRASFTPALIVLAVIWILLFVVSASYATWLELPGRHWKSFGRHVPIALGPFIAITLFTARDRLRATTDTIVVLFLTGLVIGAMALLMRNGAPGLFEHGWPEFSGNLLGAINRNYAAFACGIAVIATASLIQFVFSAKGVRSIGTFSLVAVLALVLLFEGALLIVLRSRTGYTATALGMIVWFASLMGSTLIRRSVATRLSWVVPLLIIATIAAIAAQYFSVVSDRLMVKGSSGTNLQLIGQLLLGTAKDSSADFTSGEDRLQLVKLAIDLIHQRPWLGWGPDVSQLISLYSPWPEITYLDQFHNGYLQAVLSYGVIGAGIGLVFVIAVLREAWCSRTPRGAPDRLSAPLFAAALALATYLLIFNLTETILFVKPAAMTAMFLIALACLRPPALPAKPGRIAAK